VGNRGSFCGAFNGRCSSVSRRIFRFAVRDGLDGGRLGLRDPVLRRRFWLLPVRDLLSFFVWLASFGMNQIEWRGAAFTLEKGRMVPVTSRSERG